MFETGRQRALLWSFIGSILLCAITGIIGLLLDTWGPLQERVLSTTASVAGASVLALVSTIPWQRRLWHPIGPLGCIMAAVALLLIQMGIWGNFEPHTWFKNALPISIVLSIALSTGAALSLARLTRSYEPARLATAALLTTYTAMLVYSILNDPAYPWWNRAMGIIGILTATGLVATPILHRLSDMPLDGSLEGLADNIELTCPRCGEQQALPVGKSTCSNCGLEIRIALG